MTSRLNVLVVTQIPLWSMKRRTGGPALSKMIFGYADAGHTIHLITPELSYVSASDLPDRVLLHTFKHTFHGTHIGTRKIGWLFDSAGWLVFQLRAGKIGRRLLATHHFDVVYGYDVWGIPCARKLADRARLPLVVRFQGTRMNRLLDAPLASLRFFKYFKAFRTPADLYIMTDDGSRGDRLLSRFGASEAKTRFWRNGVDIEPADGDAASVKASLGLSSSETMLMTLCRLVPEKGVAYAVEAMPGVLERFPETRLVVVGEGPQSDWLTSRAAELGVADRVLFTGGLDRRRVAELLSAADVFISMYDHSNVGNPLLEAMTCGKPIVTLDVGATGDVVIDGINGVLLQPHEAAELDRVLCDLLSDKSRRVTLGLGARDWAIANLTSWETRIGMEIDEVSKLVQEWQALG